MPVENEVKFLLRPSGFESAIKAGQIVSIVPYGIEQHYIGEGTRVRKIQDDGEPAEFVFTFKRQTSIGLVEIEQELSERDFDALRETALSSIAKRRISLPSGDEKWDVDLFETPDGDFVIAEVEMPEGRTTPQKMPPFIYGHYVESLGTDSRYSNQAMSRGDVRTELARRVAEFVPPEEDESLNVTP